MKAKLGRKGAVLIMTMMAISLLFMMVSALMQTTGIGLQNASSFFDREAALQAAQSGIDYAVTQMQTCYGWRGDSNCHYWNGSYQPTVEYGSSTKNVYVAESNGNVVGLITAQSGTKSAFRIKFSYEDNSEQTYTLAECNRFGSQNTKDLMPTLPIQMPYVSVNNLQANYPTKVYRANENGIGVTGSTANLEFGKSTDLTPTRQYACTLPGQRALVIVEGLAGKALRDCKTPAEINKVANLGKIGLVRRYVESYFSANAPMLDGNAAFAQKNVLFDISNKLFVSSLISKANSDESYVDKSTVPAPGALRSNESSIAIKGGKLNTYNGTLFRKDGQTVNFNTDTDKYSFLDSKGELRDDYVFDKNAVQNAQNSVEPIAFDDVATVKATENNKILGGLYQWHLKSDSTADQPKYELRYFSGGYKLDSQKRPIPNNPSSYKIAVAGPINGDGQASESSDDQKTPKISIGPSDKIQFITDGEGNISEPTLILSGNLYCDGDFAIACEPGVTYSAFPRLSINNRRDPNDSNLDTNYEDGVLRATGDVYVASSLYGSGAIVTSNDVTFMGGSILDSGNSGVAIYGNNVNLLSLEVAMDKSPKGEDMDQDLTASGAISGDIYKINDDFRYDMAMSCYYRDKQEKLHADKTKCLQFFKDYMKKKGVMINEKTVTIPKATWRASGLYTDGGYERYFLVIDIQFEFVNADGNSVGSPQQVHLDKDIQEYYIGWDQNANRRNKMEIPDEALMDFAKAKPASDCDNPTANLSDEMKTYTKQFGSLCYGDQIFNGVIYARNNFNADLGDRYNLSLQGALRAEKGSITVNAHSAALTYDESYLRKLMPGYNKLTQGMWNCW